MPPRDVQAHRGNRHGEAHLAVRAAGCPHPGRAHPCHFCPCCWSRSLRVKVPTCGPKAQAPLGEPHDDLGAGLSFTLRNAERRCPQCPLLSVAKSTKRTLLSGAVGKAPFPHAAMRDSSGQPRTRMDLLFSAGWAWARQGARYEDTTGIDSEHAIPIPPGHPSTPVPRDQAKGQRAPFQTLLWSKLHAHKALRPERRGRDGPVCPRADLEGGVGRTWAPFSVWDNICVFLGTAAALLRRGPGDMGTGRDTELATP